jgi:TetR/AcrR family transcriptional regulator
MPHRARPTFDNLPKPKQEAIILVALEEFSRHGYRQASLNIIVRRLGIAKGSIFQYFKGKDGLFLFLFNMALERVKDHLRQVRDETAAHDFFQRLRATLRSGVRFINAHPLFYRLYLRVMFEAGMPYRAELLTALRRASHEFLREMIDEGRARGDLLQDLDPDLGAFVLDAVMDRFLQAQCEAHLDAGLGLYGIDHGTAEKWIDGMALPGRTPDP